jgi:hypothetical protein
MNSTNEESDEKQLMQIVAKTNGLAATEALDTVLANINI